MEAEKLNKLIVQRNERLERIIERIAEEQGKIKATEAALALLRRELNELSAQQLDAKVVLSSEGDA